MEIDWQVANHENPLSLQLKTETDLTLITWKPNNVTTKMPCLGASIACSAPQGPIKVHPIKEMGILSQKETHTYIHIYISYDHSLGLIVWEYLVFLEAYISVTGLSGPKAIVAKTKSPNRQQADGSAGPG